MNSAPTNPPVPEGEVAAADFHFWIDPRTKQAISYDGQPIDVQSMGSPDHCRRVLNRVVDEVFAAAQLLQVTGKDEKDYGRASEVENSKLNARVAVTDADIELGFKRQAAVREDGAAALLERLWDAAVDADASVDLGQSFSWMDYKPFADAMEDVRLFIDDDAPHSATRATADSEANHDAGAKPNNQFAGSVQPEPSGGSGGPYTVREIGTDGPWRFVVDGPGGPSMPKNTLEQAQALANMRNDYAAANRVEGEFYYASFSSYHGSSWAVYGRSDNRFIDKLHEKHDAYRLISNLDKEVKHFAATPTPNQPTEGPNSYQGGDPFLWQHRQGLGLATCTPAPTEGKDGGPIVVAFKRGKGDARVETFDGDVLSDWVSVEKAEWIADKINACHATSSLTGGATSNG